jgi:hypothetical protein
MIAQADDQSHLQPTNERKAARDMTKGHQNRAENKEAEATIDTFGSLSDLLKAIRGKGWVGAELISEDSVQLGFKLGEWSFKIPVVAWEEQRFMEAGEQNKFIIYQTEIDGLIVDFADTSDWWNATRPAYIAVHDDDGRGVEPTAVQDGYDNVGVALRNTTEEQSGGSIH